MSSTRQVSQAWLGVVSQAHVHVGVAEGFAQVCHGKAAPLRRMRPGDFLVYYSPTVVVGGEPLRAFTALGQVKDDEVFALDAGGGFVPHRRRIAYRKVAREVPLAELKSRLELCAQPSWGIALRRGLLPLSEHDFKLIARAFDVTLPGDHAA